MSIKLNGAPVCPCVDQTVPQEGIQQECVVDCLLVWLQTDPATTASQREQRLRSARVLWQRHTAFLRVTAVRRRRPFAAQSDMSAVRASTRLRTSADSSSSSTSSSSSEHGLPDTTHALLSSTWTARFVNCNVHQTGLIAAVTGRWLSFMRACSLVFACSSSTKSRSSSTSSSTNSKSVLIRLALIRGCRRPG